MNKNLKKVISSVAVAAMVASSASAFAATFPDVDASASYASAVSNLTALGIVKGDDNGLFNPDNSVTRAEFAKMVVEALGEGDSAAAVTSSKFTDCEGHWGVGYIAQGVADGFINGYDSTTFGPNDTVTYVQAVKMLVSAVGYDNYATNAGGYPSGYLSYGSTLKITNGVSGVTNDTALTRAQCAVLISNALKAPLCVIDGYTYGGLTGNVAQPNIVQKDGKGQEWQSLLTKFHDAYVVKGRVVNTSRTSSALDPGEVAFRVESADNFDDKYVTKSDNYNESGEEMYAGDTAAEDMFRVYAEAIVQYDDAEDSWTILSINPQGSNKTVEVDASLVSDEEDYSNTMASSKKVPVRKSEQSSSVTAYKLDDDVEIFVNGVKYEPTTEMTADAILTEYILNNATGKVTLIDETEVGSTSTDGYYDCIMITYYADAVVDYTQTTASNNRVGFKKYDGNIASRLQWDPEDEEKTVTFTKDGAEIDWTELAEYDVLSIAYDVTGTFANSDFYDVQVSQNKVTGTVSSRSAEDEVVRVDGTEYDVVTSMVNLTTDIELNATYTFYINSFGYVVYADENDSSKNLGILVGMYYSNSEDATVIKFITPDGSIVTKPAKDEAEALKFYKLYDEDATVVGDISKNDVKANIQNMVFEYTTSSGKIKLKGTSALTYKGGADLAYKANSTRLGSYTLNEAVTKVLDLEAYLNDDETTPGVMSFDKFQDENEYEAYLYDRNSNNDYRLCLVIAGTGSITPDTTVAVVMSAPQQTTIDGTDYKSITVAKGDEEQVTVNYEEDIEVKEGDIVIYSLKSDGTASNFTVVMSAETDYYALFDNNGIPAMSEKINTFAKDDEENVIPNVWKWTTESKPAKAYFGPVYQKTNNNLDLFKKVTGGESSVISDIESFNVAGAKTYIYDYSAAKKYRVTAGALPNVSKSIYNNEVLTGAESENVNWGKVKEEDICPSFAFVKEVDGDVTEVVFFLAK